MKFKDRVEAGDLLAEKLMKYKAHPEAILLTIPRGALEIGAVLRGHLELPLDIVVTKKIGAPGNPEFAIGVVGPDGGVDLNPDAVTRYGIPTDYIEQETEEARKLIRRRYDEYRGERKLPDLRDKIVILADDGIATGMTTQAAVRYIRRQNPKKIVLAAPVCSPDARERLRKEVDELICLFTPEDFYAVGQFYDDFPQVSDDEAMRLLRGK